MACGVYLGILLICLIQAEHVLCLWATQARGRNGNTNVDFPQQGSGFGGSDPQNQLRRASGSGSSAQSSSSSSSSSSLDTDTEVSGGYSQRFPSSGYTQAVSQPARSGRASVRLVQSSSESKPNWPTTELSQDNVQKMPKSFGLSTNIAGSSSVSKYDQTLLSKKSTWPVPQGTPSTSDYRLSSGAAEPHRIPARTKTSASAPARRVSPRRSSVASKPSSAPSLKDKMTRNNPSQAETENQYPSKLIPVTAGKSQGSYKPPSVSHVDLSHPSYSRSLPLSNKRSAPAIFHPSIGKTLTSYTSTKQVPRSKSSFQTSWNSRNPAQEARSLPASRTSSVGTSDQSFAQTIIHNIPQRFGGYAIIRLRKPADRKKLSVGKLQQAIVAPQRPSAAPQQPSVALQRPSAQLQADVAPPRSSASYKPKVQSVHPKAKWIRIPSYMGK